MKPTLTIIENKLNNLHSKLAVSSLKKDEYQLLSFMLTEIKQMVDELKRKAVILLLLLPMMSQAQYGHTGKDLYDTREVTEKESKMIFYQDTTSSGIATKKFIIPNYDTIPVIILVCDTVTVNTPYPSHKLSIHGNLVAWINGYEVREGIKYWGGADPNGNGLVPAIAINKTRYEHVKYLDLDKKPLENNIVVWITKNRSK